MSTWKHRRQGLRTRHSEAGVDREKKIEIPIEIQKKKRPDTLGERCRTVTQDSSRGWTRTSDKTVNSRLLYQLSYAGSDSNQVNVD